LLTFERKFRGGDSYLEANLKLLQGCNGVV
jgi:hypothetical protein